MKPEHTREEQGKEILKGDEELVALETPFQEGIGEVFGELNRSQKEQLEEFYRLYESLGGRGPEEFLDTIGYSRSIPSSLPRQVLRPIHKK
jgi:hypothetical protein